MIENNKVNLPLSRTDRALSNDDVISKLNDLIQVCKDGQEGFKVAAEGTENTDFKSLFFEYSRQRADFTGVLQELVRSLGGDPEKDGSISGAVHRGWMDIKSLITGKDTEAVLNECERGEDHAKAAYAEALKENLPANVRDVLIQQSQAVLAAHNRIKELRDASDNNRSQRAATPGGY